MRTLMPAALRRLTHRLRPRRPQFAGVYPNAKDVPEEAPWDAPAWIEMSRQRLRDAAEARRLGRAPEALAPGQLLTALVVNRLARAADCSVLDFAGGSGWVYHQIEPFLVRPEGVVWRVVDSPALGLLGAEYRGPGQNLMFGRDLPDPSETYDVVHINTSLQYVMSWAELLERLLAHRPRYLVLTRLLAGPIETFVTAQDLKRRRTACVMISQEELGALFTRLGYATVLRAPASEEPLPDLRYSADIPAAQRLPHSIHWILAADRG